MDTEYINCFVGSDMEGDVCIYVKRGDEYLDEVELEEVAAKLEAMLNGEEVECL